MLDYVQLKNMYSSSLNLSDIVRGLSCRQVFHTQGYMQANFVTQSMKYKPSCQQSYSNSILLYKLIIIIPFILSITIIYFFHAHHV